MYLLPCLDTLAVIELDQQSGLFLTRSIQDSCVYISFNMSQCSFSHHCILEYIFVLVNLLARQINSRDGRSLDISSLGTYKVIIIPKSTWRESLDLYDIFDQNIRLSLIGLVGYDVCDTGAEVWGSAGPTGPPI